MSKLESYPKAKLLEIISCKEKEIAKLKSEIKIAKNTSTLILNDNEEFFSLKEIIALMPGNVFWKNKKGEYLGCNNNLAYILGFDSPDQIIGKRNADFIAKDYAAILDQIDEEVMVSKEGKYLEETGFDVSNQLAIFLTHKIPLLDHLGNAVGLLGVSLNITEQKQLEKELKAAKEKAESSNRAKSQFLAVINHELRTPLTSIIGLLDFLKQGNLSSQEEKKIINAIDNSTQYLLNLVNDVLDFSSLKNGKYNLRIKPVNLAILMQEIDALLKPLADKKNLALQADFESNLPEIILADSRVLRQIFINLISNAIKFTDKGGVTVQVKKITQGYQAICLELSVNDTGVGIPADKLDFIFEPFQQLENAYTRQSSRSGTGLGLSIVKELAEVIDAKIKVKSEMGKGTSFTLLAEFQTPSGVVASSSKPLSLSRNALQKKTRTKEIDRKASSTKNSLRPLILLVEDDPIVQFIHKKMLEDLGCNVDTVTHGREALNVFNQHNMVFVDLNLPDISGFEVIKLIRERADTGHVPIVALTAFAGSEEKKATLKAGADKFIIKPISQAALKKLLKRYFTQVHHPA